MKVVLVVSEGLEVHGERANYSEDHAMTWKWIVTICYICLSVSISKFSLIINGLQPPQLRTYWVEWGPILQVPIDFCSFERCWRKTVQTKQKFQVIQAVIFLSPNVGLVMFSPLKGHVFMDWKLIVITSLSWSLYIYIHTKISIYYVHLYQPVCFVLLRTGKKKETDAILAKIYVGRVHDKVLLFVVHMVLFCVCWRGCSNTNWILGKWAAWLSLNMYIHNSIHISYKCIYYMHIQSGVFFSPIKKNIWSLNWIIYITSSFPGSKSRSLWNSHI